VSLADRFPRLRDRQLPQWLAEAPDDDTDLVQAARQSFADAVENLERPEEDMYRSAAKTVREAGWHK
jgi:hypothetical protein